MRANSGRWDFESPTSRQLELYFLNRASQIVAQHTIQTGVLGGLFVS